MRIYRSAAFVTLTLLLASCGLMDRQTNSDEEGSPPSGKTELTGMLVIVDPEKCPLVEGCGPQFSLLGRKLDTRVALTGPIMPEHENLIISVVGRASELPADLAGKSGYETVSAAVKVKKYRLRSNIPYFPFLVEKASEVTIDQFGCDLLWDKTYSWTVENDEPLLSVRMTNTYADAPQPWVELTFNGNSGELHATALNPHNLAPCGG